MCGFFISNSAQIGQSDLNVIKNSLSFRGPDGSSDLVEKGGWKAFHSRLSIIDVNSGVNQPVLDSKGGILVFNGEILNYKELGIKYFGQEYVSDTFLLSDLIINKKLSLDELDGFFAFVYIDGSGELKHAVRDKFGAKPLFYYVEIDGSYSFSSEPITLKRLFDLEVNEQAIEEYRVARAPLFSNSFFHGVRSIQPGCCLVAGEYFNCLDYLNCSYESVDDKELEEALKAGISSRVVSDAPVGLLLSKGIDSNLLKEMSDIDSYYSIGFKGDDDIEYLKKQCIDNLKIVECTAVEYLESFEHLLNLRGEPMSVPNEVLLYRISKEAANDGVKVLLSGEGADEFFGGYDKIYNWAATADSFDLDVFLSKYCYSVPAKDSKTYANFERIFSSVAIDSAFETVRWFFVKYHLPILFRRLDFSLMAAGVEGREPIANFHTFRVAVKYTKDALMNGSLGKIPLRKLLSQFRGEQFAFEKKVGFPVDLTTIFENKKNLSSYELWFEENIKVLYK